MGLPHRLGSLALLLLLGPISAGARELVFIPFVDLATPAWDSVLVVDPRTGEIVAEVEVGELPVGIQPGPKGERVYVADAGDGLLSVIDTASLRVTDSLLLGGAPVAIAMDPRRQRVLVADWESSLIWVLESSPLGVIQTVALPPRPSGMVVDATRDRLLVVNADLDTIRALSLEDFGVLMEKPSPGRGIAISEDGEHLVTAGLSASWIHDPETLDKVDTILGTGAFTDELEIAEGTLYVASSANGLRAFSLADRQLLFAYDPPELGLVAGMGVLPSRGLAVLVERDATTQCFPDDPICTPGLPLPGQVHFVDLADGSSAAEPLSLGAGGTRAFGPLAVETAVLLTDGFESGDTSAWSG